MTAGDELLDALADVAHWHSEWKMRLPPCAKLVPGPYMQKRLGKPGTVMPRSIPVRTDSTLSAVRVRSQLPLSCKVRLLVAG